MSTPENDTKKYFVRFSRSDDFDRLMTFYKANPHKNVCDRTEDLLRELVDNGSVTIIQDAETKDIVAASVSTLLKGADGGPAHKWLEIGATRSILNGYPGLFDVMISMQVLRAFLVEPPEERFVCQMESPAVRKMAHNLGFRPYVPSDELVKASDGTLQVEETCGYDNWYSAGPEALPVVAQRMMEAIDKPYLQHLKSGQKIELDFSQSKFFQLFRDEFKELAKRDMGNHEEPDYTQSISASRQKWMRWYFR